MKEYIPNKAATKDKIVGNTEKLSKLRSSVMNFVFNDDCSSEEKPYRALAVYGPNGCGKSFILDVVLNEAIEAAKDASKNLLLQKPGFERMHTAGYYSPFDDYARLNANRELLHRNSSYKSIIVIENSDQLLFPFSQDRKNLKSFLARVCTFPANLLFVLEAAHDREEQFEPSIRHRMDSVYISNNEKDIERIVKSCWKSEFKKP